MRLISWLVKFVIFVVLLGFALGTVGVDLETGAAKGTYPFPPESGVCNDIAVANLYLELRRDNAFRSSRLIAYNKEYIGLMNRTLRELQALSTTHRVGLHLWTGHAATS